MKPCSKCRVPKELSEFSKRKISKDGYRNACKLCESEAHKKYHEVNKEYLNNRKKEYREASKEQQKEYREVNRSRIASRIKEWAKANPNKICANSAKRKGIKIKAHPPWAGTLEKRQIEEIYTLARMQSEATGKEYHVDHIHPLQAPKVVMFEGEMIPLICGLHVPVNLQILEASVNCSKSNKFEPYIESECDFTEPWQVRSDDRALIPIQTPIDRIPRRNPSALIKPRKSKGVSKGQLSLF